MWQPFLGNSVCDGHIREHERSSPLRVYQQALLSMAIESLYQAEESAAVLTTSISISNKHKTGNNMLLLWVVVTNRKLTPGHDDGHATRVPSLAGVSRPVSLKSRLSCNMSPANIGRLAQSATNYPDSIDDLASTLPQCTAAFSH